MKTVPEDHKISLTWLSHGFKRRYTEALDTSKFASREIERLCTPIYA